jgi:hypothetical protein
MAPLLPSKHFNPSNGKINGGIVKKELHFQKSMLE